MYLEATDGAKHVSLHLFRSFAKGALMRIDLESPAFYMISQVTYLKQYHTYTVFRFCVRMSGHLSIFISNRPKKFLFEVTYIVYFEYRKVIKVHMISKSHKSLKKKPQFYLTVLCKFKSWEICTSFLSEYLNFMSQSF